MTDTIREQICAALETEFQTGTDAQEVEWLPSGDPVKFPALHLYDMGQSDEPNQEAGTQRYRLKLSLDGFVSSAGGSEARKLLNKLYGQVVTVVMTFADNSTHIEEAVERNMSVTVAKFASTRRLVFSLDFEFVYATRRGDPTTL